MKLFGDENGRQKKKRKKKNRGTHIFDSIFRDRKGGLKAQEQAKRMWNGGSLIESKGKRERRGGHKWGNDQTKRKLEN